ncbi:MAG: hypothetical protein CL908_18205 [Deltaproteobacteria bacterium]|nr:hypothetical protein [Deltaproteobacteria bacterium]
MDSGIETRRFGLGMEISAESIAFVLVLILALACSHVPRHPDVDDLEAGFSDRMAGAHFRSLAGLAPRIPGSRGDATARAYLKREFQRTGASVREERDGDRLHVIAELPGRSADIVLLVAPYPALESTDWVDDSGAALLLELARVFALARPAYTLRFALAETRRLRKVQGSDARRQGGSSLWAARHRVAEAGRSLARTIEMQAGKGTVRAVITFDVSARPGLRIARDLRSHPVFRELFWQSASALGLAATFPTDGGWVSPNGLHTGFRERSVDRLLALVDESWARPDLAGRPPPDAGAGSLQGLASVGEVTVEALSRLMHRLAKIDAF